MNPHVKPPDGGPRSSVSPEQRTVPSQESHPPPNDQPSVVRCSISPHFHNKQNLARDTLGKKAHVVDFVDRTLSLPQLVEHILTGGRWSPGIFTGNYRTGDNWTQSELIGLDFDDNVSVADCRQVDFIAQYASLIHPSSSSKHTTEKNPAADFRTRVIFRLSEPIRDKQLYDDGARGLAQHLGLETDRVSYSVSTGFYGSNNRVEPPHVNYEAVLPIEIFNAFAENVRQQRAEEQAARERHRAEMNYQPVNAGSDRVRKKVQEWLERSYHKVASATHERTNVLHGQSIWLHGLVEGGWPVTETEAERTLLDAAHANGSVEKYGEREIMRHISNGAKKATPFPLELPDPYWQSEPTHDSQSLPISSPNGKLPIDGNPLPNSRPGLPLPLPPILVENPQWPGWEEGLMEGELRWAWTLPGDLNVELFVAVQAGIHESFTLKELENASKAIGTPVSYGTARDNQLEHDFFVFLDT